jgi:peptidoglycan/xylan/chitin deacetylase (PgdA/CDA1 family)
MGELHGRRLMAASSLALAMAVTAVLGGCPSDPAPVDDACSGGQALTATGAAPLTGAGLANKQLALTFDDGPGSRTLELSTYLKTNGIPAVFFQNGKCYDPASTVPCRFDGAASTAATILPQLIADGHLVGNHTEHHWDLTTDTTHFPNNATGNAAILKELTDTDAVIAPYVPNQWFLFRAPYGSFGSRPFNLLHASAMDKYFGHVGWDIGGTYTGTDATGYAADWYCWQNAKTTTKKCGDRYMHEIAAVHQGIVLMHDADYGNVANTSLTTGIGNTIDMVKYLVPLLKAAGYTFVRADQAPAIKALLPPPVVDAGPEGGDDAGSDAEAGDASDTVITSSSSSSSSTSSSSSGEGRPPPSPCPPPAPAPDPGQPAPASARSPHAH